MLSTLGRIAPAFCVLLAGCSSTSVIPTLPTAATVQQDYVLERGDRVRIRIWPDSSLGGDYLVEGDGQLYLPALGTMQAAGVPLSQLRTTLRDQYSEVMRNPTVSVVPLFRVSVLGAVTRPGLYEVDPTQGVVDAISLAGGFRPNARENKIRIVRAGEELRLDDATSVATDPRWALRSGDRIIVPEGWDIEARDVLYVLQGAALVFTLYRQTQE